MNDAFWKDRSVFVTGHTGFKGAWLTLWLKSLGARVTGFSLPPPTQPSLFVLAGVDHGITSIIGDVRDPDAVRAALVEAQPEVIFHLAAQPLVRASYANPIETYATNVMGTVHLLNAARQIPSLRSVVVITSDKCYENKEWHWAYNEGHPLGGHDPYSNSKACTELVVDAFRRSFFSTHSNTGQRAALTSARAGNVIGGGDWAVDRLVPDVITALIHHEKIILRNPLAVRPWQHVLEPLFGYLTLAEAAWRDGERFAGAWNFGPFEHANKTVAWVTERLCELWGSSEQWEQDHAVSPHECKLLQVDSAKARALLGWAPKLDPLAAIEWTVAWAKAWQAGSDLRRFSEEQIATFAALPPYDTLAFPHPARWSRTPDTAESVPAAS